MLFLAVSGVMVAALLGGWTLMINTQRYKDSIDTVYGYIQDQYNLVYNVENERSSTLRCTSGGITEGGGPGDSRGQSDCVLMGRYIELTGGTTFRSYAVVGYEPTTEVTGSDSEQIKQYTPTVVGQSIGLTEAEQVVPWAAVIKRPDGSSALNANILLLRSPTSGIVHRYVVDGERVEPKINDNDIDPANEDKDSVYCFDPGAPVQGAGQAVVIRAYASTRNSVETIDGGKSGC